MQFSGDGMKNLESWIAGVGGSPWQWLATFLILVAVGLAFYFLERKKIPTLTEKVEEEVDDVRQTLSSDALILKDLLVLAIDRLYRSVPVETHNAVLGVLQNEQKDTPENPPAP